MTPPRAPAHQVMTKANAIVLGMNRRIPCSRSSHDWPSLIGTSILRQKPSSGSGFL